MVVSLKNWTVGWRFRTRTLEFHTKEPTNQIQLEANSHDDANGAEDLAVDSRRNPDLAKAHYEQVVQHG